MAAKGSDARRGAALPFEWGKLESLTADRVAREVRARGVLALFSVARLKQACQELCAADIEGLGFQRAEGALRGGGAVVLDVGGHHVRVVVEPQAAAFLLQRILTEPVLLDSGEPLVPELLGAWSALVLELARRSVSGAAPCLVMSGGDLEDAWSSAFWLQLDGRSFRGRLDIRPAPTPMARRPLRPAAELRLQLPLVVGAAPLTRTALASLREGDSWLPGDGLWLNTSLEGSAVALAPECETGFLFDISKATTYRGTKVLGQEVPLTNDGIETAMSNKEAEEIVMEAPVIVRIEVGSVTLSGAEWLALQPGDIVRTGVAVGSKVVLRVAGQQMATGELVAVDGELGVRLSVLKGAGSA